MGLAGVVRLLLKRGAKVEDRDENRLLSLAEAARGGHPDIVLMLLEAGAGADGADARGWMAL